MKKNQNHVIDILFTLTLFGVFAASSLLVVILGAKVYENISHSMTRNFTSRTAVSYVCEKMRQRDVIGAVEITDVDGIPAVSLIRQYDLDFVRTYIYCDDGYLKELNVNGMATPDKSAGQNIMELSDFNISQIGENMYYITVEDVDGTRSDAYLSAKCNSEIRGSAQLGPDATDDADGLMAPDGLIAPDGLMAPDGSDGLLAPE